MPAIVNSWSDSQIVATVSAGAASGSAQVLQNGVMSNSVPFTINLPHISSISPNSGSVGTMVAIYGSGFGAAQGSGAVWIGSTYGEVSGWSDSQVLASVSPNAVSGVVKVQQSGNWSNAMTFTVPPSISGQTPVTLVPNVLNMLVGDTRSIQALDSSGQAVTGLTWTSSNTNIVTLSAADPPLVTAVAAGNATITAGGASADVTVFAGGSFPIGTVLWSNPGDGSGVSSIMPAVPSASGVDVFALQADGNVQAIRTDGTTAWTAYVGTNTQTIPDFQGGLVVTDGYSLWKLDGLTGQTYPSYASVSGNGLSTPVVHTDGTIFTLDGTAVVGIDPLTGQAKFSVPLPSGAWTTTYGTVSYCWDPPALAGSLGARADPAVPSGSNLIIAGDGYAYLPYFFTDGTGQFTDWCDEEFSAKAHLGVLRVGTGGDADAIELGQWTYTYSIVPPASHIGAILTERLSAPYPFITSATLITNADSGVLLSWQASTPAWCAFVSFDQSYPPSFPPIQTGCEDASTTFNLATIEGASLASLATVNIPGQAAPLQPIVQRADGSYVGTVGIGPQPGQVTQTDMIAFTPSGNVLWTVPNDAPRMATSDGGVVADSGMTYDQNGNATGQLAISPILSWTGNAYQLGPVQQVAALVPNGADVSFSPESGSNLSQNGTALQRCAPLDSATAANLEGAYSALTNFLLGAYCPFCNASIFKPLDTSQAEFTSFLRQGHEFCDGMKSQEPGGSIGRSENTVADAFRTLAAPPDLTEAATALGGPKTFPAKVLGITIWTFSSSERKNLKTFFAPQNLSSDLADLESTEFHEALHGFSGLRDGGMPKINGIVGLCDVLGATAQTKIAVLYTDCWDYTKRITYWIEDNIIAPRQPH
jgi:hypothetical protein